MNASRSIWAVARGLRCLGLVVVVVSAAIGCGADTSKGPAQRPSSEKSTFNNHAAENPAGGVVGTEASPPSQDEGSLNAISYGAPGGGTPSNVIKSFDGNGSRNSASFLVNADTVMVDYSYDCSSVGGSGSFAADMISVSPGSLGYDEHLIANEVGVRDSARLTLYPQQAGGNYRLRVNSDCTWVITVTNG